MGRPKKIQFFFNHSKDMKTAFTFRYLNSDDMIDNETIYSTTKLADLPSVNNLKKQIQDYLQKECSIDNFLLQSINRL